ncbi:MAG: terminase gpA endonuclease subunit [Verrucomicrobiota bacterium]
MKGYLDAFAWVRSRIRGALKPRALLSIWQWIDRHVVIPIITGSPNAGPLKTISFPIYRGLYELVQQPHVHYFLLCKSARVGGTLFCLNLLLHKISERPGPILWLDPTRTTARRFSRGELQPFLLACKPVAAVAVISKSTWTTLEMQFRACMLRIVGSGSAAELGGYQAEMVIRNERDKLRQEISGESSSADLAEARSKQFAHTRLILDNSTPTLDTWPTWTEFQKGSRHYSYLPCPHCQRRQRLTFFPEKCQVPFDEDGRPLPEGQTREETTGRVRFEQFKLWREETRQDGTIERVENGYDFESVERGATYECAHCGKDIEHVDLGAMLAASSGPEHWWAHNPKAPIDRITAHISALYSPFETWGQLAKKFLLARGVLKKLHDFYNADLGLPFVRFATAVKASDIELVVKRCPRPYVLRQMPFEAEILTMTVDVGAFGFWWSIRAHGVLWDHADLPTWSALLDYGPVVSWDQIEELAGIKPDDAGAYNLYRFKRDDGTVREYQVTAGIIDSGYDAQEGKKVYEFCERHSHIFSPSKGAPMTHMRGSIVRESPVFDDKLDLVLYWDDWFKQELYYHHIKEARSLWWLPTNLDTDYIAQLTAERTEKQHGKLVWVVEGEQGNHIGDTEKMHCILAGKVEEFLEDIRIQHAIEEEKSAGK